MGQPWPSLYLSEPGKQDNSDLLLLEPLEVSLVLALDNGDGIYERYCGGGLRNKANQQRRPDKEAEEAKRESCVRCAGKARH